jgi:hypothetical protein
MEVVVEYKQINKLQQIIIRIYFLKFIMHMKKCKLARDSSMKVSLSEKLLIFFSRARVCAILKRPKQ